MIFFEINIGPCGRSVRTVAEAEVYGCRSVISFILGFVQFIGNPGRKVVVKCYNYPNYSSCDNYPNYSTSDNYPNYSTSDVYGGTQ